MGRLFVDKKNIIIAILAIIILTLVSSLFVRKENPPEISKSAVEQQKIIDSNVAGVQTEPSITITSTKESSTKKDIMQAASLIKVVDGDTIAVSINGKNETVRIIGIDTPEVVDTREKVECFGKEASDFARLTLEDNKSLFLESDSTQGERDKYKRLLRYVWIDDAKVDFGKLMIDGGYATEYTYATPYKFQELYRLVEEDARESRKGLWANDACILDEQSSPSAQQEPSVDISSGDKDCSDFSTHKDAQDYFVSKGGSPTNNVDRLDSDHDGIACESLP